MMDRFKRLKEQLMCQVECEMANPAAADTHELGEVIDMIKDLEEAGYYCSIIQAMEEASPEEIHYYTEKYKPHNKSKNVKRIYNNDYEDWEDDDWDYMEYPESRTSRRPKHDEREGRSPKQRKMYMESKELHKDKTTQLKELDKYIQELSADIVEMIEDASNDERMYLEKKIAALATKIGQMNG